MMSWKNIVKYVVTIVIIGAFLLTGIAALAQESSTNGILLEVPKVSINKETQDTEKIGTNKWRYNGSLNLDDEIRYKWNDVALDLYYKNNPTTGAGWLKVYLNDDTTEDNLLLEHGSSPLPVALLQDKIPEGPVSLLLVYVNSVTKEPYVPATKVQMSFEFKNTSSKPRVKVVSPKPGIVLANGVNHEFKLELNNFALTSSTKPEEGVGKLNIYQSNTSQENLVATINSSIEQEDGQHIVAFDSKDIEFNKIPDSEGVDLIFALTNVTGDLLEYQDVFKVKTNYNQSINVGLPRVVIVEPRKDRLDLSMNGNQKFILQVDNFELLDSFESGATVDGKKGFLQIFVDNKPIKTIWPRSEFSLNEIGYVSDIEGQKTIDVQLINPDFTKLAPEAKDTVTIVYIPETAEDMVENAVGGANDNWRVVIIILVLLMIGGGIVLLITKG